MVKPGPYDSADKSSQDPPPDVKRIPLLPGCVRQPHFLYTLYLQQPLAHQLCIGRAQFQMLWIKPPDKKQVAHCLDAPTSENLADGGRQLQRCDGLLAQFRNVSMILRHQN